MIKCECYDWKTVRENFSENVFYEAGHLQIYLPIAKHILHSLIHTDQILHCDEFAKIQTQDWSWTFQLKQETEILSEASERTWYRGDVISGFH